MSVENNNTSTTEDKFPLSEILFKVFGLLGLSGALGTFLLPLYNYTFREPLPGGWGWRGNEQQLLLFGWQVWGAYINLALAFVVSIVLLRHSRTGFVRQAVTLAVILSILMVIVSFSGLFNIHAMLFPPLTIPTIRDDEPFITILAPIVTGLLFLLASLIKLGSSFPESE